MCRGTQRHTWSDLQTFPQSDYQAHKDTWEQGAGESSRSVSIWQERQGNRDYSLSAIFPINPQMANLQRFNASIICKERDKITLQVWNKTNIMCYSCLLHLNAIFVAFFFQKKGPRWIEVDYLAFGVLFIPSYYNEVEHIPTTFSHLLATPR